MVRGPKEKKEVIAFFPLFANSWALQFPPPNLTTVSLLLPTNVATKPSIGSATIVPKADKAGTS